MTIEFCFTGHTIVSITACESGTFSKTIFAIIDKMNDKVYIKFNNPKGKPSTPTGRLKKSFENALIKFLSSIVPKANPDFDHLIKNVDYWKIEYNTEEKATWREIGFDEAGNPIVAMPLGNNYGFWTDNQLTLDDYERFDSTPISADEFENDWREFGRKNQK